MNAADANDTNETGVLATLLQPLFQAVPADLETQPVVDPARTAVNAVFNQQPGKSVPVFNVNLQDNPWRGPFAYQAHFTQPDATMLNVNESLSQDGKPLPVSAVNTVSAGVNSLINLESLTAVSPSAPAGNFQQGSASLLGNGQNMSFLQLMSQGLSQPITQNIHNSEWGGAVGQRISWMIGNKLQSAQLRITPAHLGPVDIKLSIENNIANVSFLSNHQVVREALEQAIPKLKEMLEEQKLDLGNVDISDKHQAGKGEEFADTGTQSGHGLSANESSATMEQKPSEEQSPAIISASGLIDFYA